MKKIYVLLFALFSVWQINAQVLNQSAGWPNAAWTVTGTYSVAAGAYESDPTTTDSFAWDDDDAGNPSDDSIAAESPVINLTAAHTAGEQKVRASVQYGYRFLTGDQLRFEYWDADAAAWTAWGANIPGNNTTVTDVFCNITKTNYTTTDLDVSAFTATQLSGFKYRISYDDNPAGTAWNWGFCFSSPTIISVPTPCLTGTNLPATLTTPSACDGITPTVISTTSHAGDYFYVAVTTGQTYKFSSSVATDYFTLSTDDGLTAAVGGTSTLTWVSTITGNLRVHLNTNITCGTSATDRTTSVLCGTVCLTGGLYPADTYTAETCDGTTVNLVVDDTWAGEYSNINVFDANEYVFSSSVATDYITVANTNGTVALAAGTGTVSFSPTADGVVRVYFHSNSTCGTQNVNRERRIVCTSTISVPQCASNPTPTDGADDVPAFDNVGLFWDAPTTGEPATSYDVYIGDSAATLQFAVNVPTNEIPNAGAVGAYSTTIFWQIVPRNAAGAATGCAVWSFTTEPQPTDAPDYVGLQFPAAATINQGETVNVYGQVYEAGLTDVPPIESQAAGIIAWVGVSADDVDPSTWDEAQWAEATYNAGHTNDNNDEYQGAIGAGLAPGTYYYAVRFQLNDGPFVYGGINTATDPDSGNFWDGTTYLNGVLTVNAAPAPANDECAGAIALTPGGVFGDQDITTTNLGATATDGIIPSCQAEYDSNVWYSVVVPASGNITIETQSSGSGFTDGVVTAFSGTCGALTAIECDDDDGVGFFSLLSLTGQTPGSTLYISVWRYGLGAGVDGTFNISAYDASLGNDSFDNANFEYYPNPVKNTLNLSYNKEISNVEVYNLLGQKVISNSINATTAQVDMSNLSKGAYMVKVTSDNQVKTVKVIKE